MIKPVKINNINFKNTTFTSNSKEVRGLWQSAAGLFDCANFSTLADNVSISRDGADLDLVKNVGEKKVALSRFPQGNLLLQVVDNVKETVDVIYHDVLDSTFDRFYRYTDTELFPWSKGKDAKIYSKRVVGMSAEERDFVTLMCKEYIPEFIRTVSETLPAKLLKKP